MALRIRITKTRYYCSCLALYYGTNGKATVTGMLNNMLQAGGVESCVAGNIGTPVISVIHEQKYEVILL